MRRRDFLASATAATAVTSMPGFAVAQQHGVRTLRFVPQANLAMLDPIATSASMPMIPLGQFHIRAGLNGFVGFIPADGAYFWNLRRV